VNCIIIVQFPIENHSEQGQFAELSLKTIGKSEKKGDYYAIRSSVEHHSSGWFCAGGLDQMRSSSTATSINCSNTLCVGREDRAITLAMIAHITNNANWDCNERVPAPVRVVVNLHPVQRS
jgi:Tfp pilus assembly major pilin PilA